MFGNRLSDSKETVTINNVTNRNRRRSRLGKRFSIVNFEKFNSSIIKETSPCPIPDNKTDLDLSENKNECVKKRLFSVPSISRRLNMDTSSFIKPSDYSPDLDITGVYSIPETEKKKCNNTSVINQNNGRNHLSSLENLILPRSTKTSKSPIKFLTNSSWLSKNSSYKNDGGSELLGLKKTQVKTSPLKPSFSNMSQMTTVSQKLVETEMFSNGNNNFLSSKPMQVKKSLTSEPVKIRKSFSYDNICSIKSLDNKNGLSKSNNPSYNFRPNNSLEFAFDLAYKTDKESNNLSGESYAEKSSYSVDTNNTEETSHCDNIDKIEDLSVLSDNIPENCTNNTIINISTEDESTEKYILNEKIFDVTITCENVEESSNEITIVKNVELSVKKEDNCRAEKFPENDSVTCFQKPDESMISLSKSKNLNKLHKVGIDKVDNVCTNLQLKLADTLDRLEQSNRDYESFVKEQDKKIDELNQNILLLHEKITALKLEKNEFLLLQREQNENLLDLLKDIKESLHVKTDFEKYDSFLVSPSVDFDKTVNCNSTTASVYNKLRSDISFLKTPVSTVKKNKVKSCHLLTPNTMSVRIQNQVNDLFED